MLLNNIWGTDQGGHALDPLTPAQRQVVVDTLRRYLAGVGERP